MLFNFKEIHRERIPVFKIGVKVNHAEGDFTPDEEFISIMERSFTEFHKDKSYRPPVLRNHNDKEGITYGKVISLEREGDILYANVEWAIGMRELRESGKVSNFSPSFHHEFQDPHSDKVYKYLFRELSFVSIPHLKNLPSAEENHYSLLEGSNPDETIVCPTPYNLQELFMAKELEEEDQKPTLEERMDRMEAALAELVEDKEEDPQEQEEDEDEVSKNEEDEEDENPVENSECSDTEAQATETAIKLAEENSTLKQRIQALENREFKRELSGKIPNLDDETFTTLMDLKANSTKLYESTVTILSEKSSKTEDVTSVVKGRVGSPKGTLSLSEAKKQADEKNLHGAAKLDYLQSLGFLK